MRRETAQRQPTAAARHLHQRRERRQSLSVTLLKTRRLLQRRASMATSGGINQEIPEPCHPVSRPQTLGTQHVPAVLAIQHRRLRQPSDRAETTSH